MGGFLGAVLFGVIKLIWKSEIGKGDIVLVISMSLLFGYNNTWIIIGISLLECLIWHLWQTLMNLKERPFKKKEIPLSPFLFLTSFCVALIKIVF